MIYSIIFLNSYCKLWSIFVLGWCVTCAVKARSVSGLTLRSLWDICANRATTVRRHLPTVSRGKGWVGSTFSLVLESWASLERRYYWYRVLILTTDHIHQETKVLRIEDHLDFRVTHFITEPTTDQQRPPSCMLNHPSSPRKIKITPYTLPNTNSSVTFSSPTSNQPSKTYPRLNHFDPSIH